MTDVLRPWLRLAVALAILSAVSVAAVGFVSIRADMTVVMPERQSAELGLLFRAMREGPANRLILLALEPGNDDGPVKEPGRLSEAFKAALTQAGFFEQVSNGDVAMNEARLQPFFAHRYRLDPPLDPEQFTSAGLRAALQSLLLRLQGFGAPFIATIMAADPTLRTPAVAARWAAMADTEKRQGVWVGGDGRRVLLLATTAGKGFDFARQQAMIAAVRAAAAGLEPTFGPLRLTLSGPSVIAAESRRHGEAESRRLMLLSIPLVAGLLLLFFRHLAVLPLAVLPLASGLVAGALVVSAAFGFVHVTTLGFGAILIGVAADYPIHLMAHVNRDAMPAQAARRIWPALLLGVGTTVLGFLPLALSGFPGVAQLGVFTITGLAVAAAMTRWIMPHVMPARLAGIRAPVRWMPSLPVASIGRLRPYALGLGALAAGFLIARGPDLWHPDIAALSPIPEPVRADDELLRRHLNAVSPRYLLTVAGASVAEVLERSEALAPRLDALRDAGVLDGYDLAARYVASPALQRARLAALPDDAALRANLATAQSGLPFEPDTFEPFLQAVAAARAAGPLQPAGIDDAVLRSRLQSLLLRAEPGYRGLVLLHRLRHPDELRDNLTAAALPGVRFLDTKAATQDLMDSYRRETSMWVALGAGLALALLVAAIRSVGGVAAIAGPVALSVVVTAAAMAQISNGLTIFHLLALMMVAGLGVDYAVFLRRSRGRGGERTAGHDDDLRAVCLCAATSFCVFAVLASASVPILAQIGSTVALGSVLSLVFGLVFTARETHGVR